METRENKMGTMPEGRLLFGMAIPMMISMLLQALYNVVDSYFVSRVSLDAFNALSLAFPLQALMIGLGAGTGLGVNALISRSLGETWRIAWPTQASFSSPSAPLCSR